MINNNTTQFNQNNISTIATLTSCVNGPQVESFNSLCPNKPLFGRDKTYHTCRAVSYNRDIAYLASQ